MMNKRDTKIVEYARGNPCASLRSMGRYHDLSGERVRQILVKAGILHREAGIARGQFARTKCSECGEPLTSPVNFVAKTDRPRRCRSCSMRPVELQCEHCDKLYPVSQLMLKWQTQKYKHPLRYCPDCRHPPCATCGIPVVKRSSAVAAWRTGVAKHVYCVTYRLKQA